SALGASSAVARLSRGVSTGQLRLDGRLPGREGLPERLGVPALHPPTSQPNTSSPSADRHSIGVSRIGVNTDGAWLVPARNGQGSGSAGARRTLPANTSPVGARLRARSRSV